MKKNENDNEFDWVNLMWIMSTQYEYHTSSDQSHPYNFMKGRTLFFQNTLWDKGEYSSKRIGEEIGIMLAIGAQ